MHDPLIIIQPTQGYINVVATLYVYEDGEPVEREVGSPVPQDQTVARCEKLHPGVRLLGWDQCFLCNKHIRPIDYYMVHDEVWEQANVPEPVQIHQACLEQRIGRLLTLADYTECGVNEKLFKGAELLMRQVEAEDRP